VDYGESPVFVPVEHADDWYVLEITVWAEVTVSCDFSFSVLDGIDKDYVTIGSSYVYVDEEMQFWLTVTIRGDPDDDFAVDAIEVVRSDTVVEFGEVEPVFRDPDY
jgi:hypothetical protein